jgi:Methyltransferase domain
MKKSPPQTLTYHPLERLAVPRPVDRIAYVKERCKGLRVLDLGAYDETEISKAQHKSWKWLHAEIAGSAKEVLGVDASPQLQLSGGIQTRVGTRIIYGSVENLDQILKEFKPDLIVAGELIEHTNDTLGWLSRIAEIAPGTRLLATTPNTTSILNIALAFLRRENCHPDHLQVYSFKTLSTLSSRVPMHDTTIVPYYYTSHIFQGRVPRFLAPAVKGVDVMILKPIQYLFPLTAFGLILEGTFGPAAS